MNIPNFRNLVFKALADIDSSLEGILDALVENIINAETVFVTGVGKSGFLARKLAASLQSLSVRAHFLCPMNALHGDIGPVSEKSLVVIFSKSGNSSELKALLPAIKVRKSKIAAISCRKESYLTNAANLSVVYGINQEGDKLNSLPLISIQVGLFISDLVVAKIVDVLGFDKDQLHRNHPSGQLAWNVGLTLNDLDSWKSRRPFVKIDDTLKAALIADSQFKAGLCVVVDDDFYLQGIVTDGDVRRALIKGSNIEALNVSDLLNENPIALKSDSGVGECIQVMESSDKFLYSAPVVDQNKRCLGVLIYHDLFRNN
ncbi:MAG: SIS domain-containing protein [Opitutales bacterium]